MRETVFYRPAGIAPIPDVVQRVRHYSGKVEDVSGIMTEAFNEAHTPISTQREHLLARS